MSQQGGHSTMTAHDGEHLTVVERLVVAPSTGRFEPAIVDGADVTTGQSLGVVIRSDERIPVICGVDGRFMGHLVDLGDRVRDGQPVAWVRLAS